MGAGQRINHRHIEHHEVLPGTSASLAPGVETPAAMAQTKDCGGYWARR